MLRAVSSSVAAPPKPSLRLDLWRLAPVLAALALGVVFLVLEPRTVDMAGHTFRAELFGREGFTIWNGLWYGGHHTPAYSVLSPPLSWLLSPALALVLSALAATALFESLVIRHFGSRRARWGALWFGLAMGALLFTGRLPFALGAALGLAALLLLQRRRPGFALVFALLCPLASPVSGLFLALALLAYGLAARGENAPRARWEAAVLAGAAFLPTVLLSLAFPEGGWAPFPFSAYFPIPIFTAMCLLFLPREERALRIGALVYGVASTVALAVDTPIGGTAVRLGALFGGPLLLCAVSGRTSGWGRARLGLLAACLVGLAVWQWSAPVRDLVKVVEDPTAEADYFEPLRDFLATLPDQRRIEIPFTRSHWESAEIAPEAPLARGWLRQIDTGHNPIFYEGQVNRLTYASWLAENAVRYVALPSAVPDRSSYSERALIEQGPPYLRLRWRSDHWRVYEVLLSAPFVLPEGRASMSLEQLRSDELLLDVRRPGRAVVRVRWTPYWYVPGGCVERAGKWTRVTARRSGFVELSTRFAPERLVQRGRRCDAG